VTPSGADRDQAAPSGADRDQAAPSGPDHGYTVTSREERFAGSVFSVVSDGVEMPDGSHAVRDYARHIGAVAIVAIDGDGRVVLIRQYRHPIGRHLWELPAGLLDVTGEPTPQTAARELAEEADMTAATWNVLVDLHTSPGYSTEFVRVYLARDLSTVPHDERHERMYEEADLSVHQVDLDEAVSMVQRGEITSSSTVAGLLAAARARDEGWRPVRPV
jgi:8-oxo-dGDP phosphatase